MSERLARLEPVASAPLDLRGVTVTLAQPMRRYSLRARDRALLEAALSLPLPAQIGETRGPAACLGPDEWLLRLPDHQPLAIPDGQRLGITEISERAVCLVVEGPRAAAVLMAGCPLDLDRFANGRATRTVFETVEIVLLRTGESRFEVEVWRSFAPWLKSALEAAAE
ncbi:sarcosine oxidase subunit gamma [Novosphingobium aquiterrae]|uniref:Sarcosine oxidase subunit gamma n=1 Tax=Novosphingobium aquiterrae TaxID=624388 RepID=A0ABV6PLG3_9SPHN